jgi:hypothetical protein
MLSQDRAKKWVRRLGWATMEAVHLRTDGEEHWEIHARRAGHVVIVRAWTQTEAWKETLRMTGLLDRGR